MKKKLIIVGVISFCLFLFVTGMCINGVPNATQINPETGENVVVGIWGAVYVLVPAVLTALCTLLTYKKLKTKENKSKSTDYFPKGYSSQYQQSSNTQHPVYPSPSMVPSPSDSLSAKETANTDFHQNLKKEIVPSSKNGLSSSQKENLSKSKEKETNPLLTIKALEDWFETNYKFARGRLLNAFDRQKFYDNMLKQLSHLDIPLIVKVRCEQLCEEYKIKFQQLSSIEYIDSLNGNEFEEWCADLLCKMSFQNIQITEKSGDQGVDILSEKDGVKYAIQCKCYSTDLGNTPIQEVESGRVFYGCHVGVVMTNRYFTKGAKELAQKTGTLLWDRKFISNMVDQLGYAILNSKAESTTDQN